MIVSGAVCMCLCVTGPVMCLISVVISSTGSFFYKKEQILISMRLSYEIKVNVNNLPVDENADIDSLHGFTHNTIHAQLSKYL